MEDSESAGVCITGAPLLEPNFSNEYVKIKENPREELDEVDLH